MTMTPNLIDLSSEPVADIGNWRTRDLTTEGHSAPLDVSEWVKEAFAHLPEQERPSIVSVFKTSCCTTIILAVVKLLSSEREGA
jgi:hypothetical protein